jgi:hypothetical protein
MHGDIETNKPKHMAAALFNALTIDTAVAEYSAPEETCVIIEDKLYRVGSLGNLAVKIWRLEHCWTNWLENSGVRAMATQIVMDRTGDTRHYFDAMDPQTLLKAEERFRVLTRLGFIAAVRTSSGEAAVTRRFDPTAEETLFFPRLVGG